MCFILYCGHINKYRPRKKKTLFYGHDQPRFSILGVFSFFSLLKSCKSAVFGQSRRKFGGKFFENNVRFFFSFLFFFFLFFWQFLCFRVSFLSPERKKNIKGKKKLSRPTDPTWKVRSPVKQGFFFSWPYGYHFESSGDKPLL